MDEKIGSMLTVGKYPNVKTERRLVLPQAPSPIMTSFLNGTRLGQQTEKLKRKQSRDENIERDVVGCLEV